MSTNPPSEIVNAGFKVINNEDGFIYEYVGIGWVRSKKKATKEDFLKIPQLI